MSVVQAQEPCPMTRVSEANMLIEQVMHDNPETLTPDHLLKDALQVYERHGVNCVPILDADQKVRGILTVFRLLHAVRGGKSFDTPIGEVMDVDLVSIRNDDTFGVACSMPIDRMLVLDHDDKLVGVLTKKELIHKIYTAFCSAHGHNRELREIINCANDGIVVFDGKGAALFHNDTLHSLLPKGDSIVSPQSPAMEAVAKLLKKTLINRRAGSILLEDCGGKQVFFTTTPLFDEGGEPVPLRADSAGHDPNYPAAGRGRKHQTQIGRPARGQAAKPADYCPQPRHDAPAA